MENDASSATRKLCTAVLAALLISATAPALAGDVDPKAGEGSQQPAAAGSKSTSPAPAEEPGPKPGEGTSDDTSPAPAGEVGRRPGEGNSPPPPSSKPSPQRFEPTEKVRPDFDVAFPVDI